MIYPSRWAGLIEIVASVTKHSADFIEKRMAYARALQWKMVWLYRNGFECLTEQFLDVLNKPI